MTYILDPSFKYIPANKTNVKKTFDRIRKEQKEAAKIQANEKTQSTNIIFNKKFAKG